MDAFLWPVACCHTGTTVTPGAEVFQNQIMDISNQSLSAYATRRADDDNLDDIVRLSLALESASVRTREEVDESSVQQYHRYSTSKYRQYLLVKHLEISRYSNSPEMSRSYKASSVSQKSRMMLSWGQPP